MIYTNNNFILFIILLICTDKKGIDRRKWVKQNEKSNRFVSKVWTIQTQIVNSICLFIKSISRIDISPIHNQFTEIAVKLKFFFCLREEKIGFNIYWKMWLRKIFVPLESTNTYSYSQHVFRQRMLKHKVNKTLFKQIWNEEGHCRCLVYLKYLDFWGAVPNSNEFPIDFTMNFGITCSMTFYNNFS